LLVRLVLLPASSLLVLPVFRPSCASCSLAAGWRSVLERAPVLSLSWFEVACASVASVPTTRASLAIVSISPPLAAEVRSAANVVAVVPKPDVTVMKTIMHTRRETSNLLLRLPRRCSSFTCIADQSLLRTCVDPGSGNSLRCRFVRCLTCRFAVVSCHVVLSLRQSSLAGSINPPAGTGRLGCCLARPQAGHQGATRCNGPTMPTCVQRCKA
jgi:hypothetical protein